jgi:putative FmdB family regulatory protein
MPTYGYRCGACGHEFEIVQKISDEPLGTCPKCQGKLSKILYPTGVIFKGSGYYTTDYKASSGSPASTGNGSSSGSDTKTETKTETKSEGKSESKADAKPTDKSDSKTEKGS